MTTNSADQSNHENVPPTEGGTNQEAIAGEGPPKTAKQLAKEAEKAEKMRKFDEKQKAKAKADEQVSSALATRRSYADSTSIV